MTPPRAARSPFTLLTPIVIGVVVASAAVIFLVFLVIPSRGKVQTDAQRPDAPAINAPGVSELPKPKQEGHPINRINEPLFLEPTSTPEELAMAEPTKRPTKTPTEEVVVEFSSTPRVIRTPTPTYAAPVIDEQPTVVWAPTEAPPPPSHHPRLRLARRRQRRRRPRSHRRSLRSRPGLPRLRLLHPRPLRLHHRCRPPIPLRRRYRRLTPPQPRLSRDAAATATATVPIIEGPPVTETPTDLTATPGRLTPRLRPARPSRRRNGRRPPPQTYHPQARLRRPTDRSANRLGLCDHARMNPQSRSRRM